MNGARSAANYSATAVLLLFLVYFLLSEGQLFKEKLVKLSGERLSQKKVTVQMIDEIIGQVATFVFYQFWSGLLVGVVTWLCFMWIGVRYAGLWGVAAGVLNCIPYFGPTIVRQPRRRRAAAIRPRRWCARCVPSVDPVNRRIPLAPIATPPPASTHCRFVSVILGLDVGPLGLILAVGADDHQDRRGPRRVVVGPDPRRSSVGAHPHLPGGNVDGRYVLPSVTARVLSPPMSCKSGFLPCWPVQRCWVSGRTIQRIPDVVGRLCARRRLLPGLAAMGVNGTDTRRALTGGRAHSYSRIRHHQRACRPRLLLATIDRLRK